MTRNLQQHILETASALFYSQGIKATGVDAIVKAAGTTKMSLYKYFPSKDELVLAHLQKSREDMQKQILDGMAARLEAPKQQLLAIFDVFEQLMGTPEFRGCPFINAAAEFAAENNPVQQASAEFYAAFRGTLADLAKQAGIENAEELAGQLVLLIAGAVVGEQMQRNSGSMQRARAAATILIEAFSAAASN
jgi:AcrR family transcriptional regulator